MSSIFFLLLFLFGLAIGSFLNVLIERLPRGQKITGRSKCPHCDHQLGFWDLVPLLSFFVLNRRCRYCGEKISWWYPLVELVTALSFVAVGLFSFGSLFLTGHWLLATGCWLLSLFLASAFIVLFFADLRFRVVPDVIVWPAVGVALLRAVLINPMGLIGPILAGLGAAAFFLFLHLAGRGKWMGFGDVELALLVGLLVDWPNILVALSLSFLTGAVVSLILMAVGRKRFGQVVPFGPFMIAGLLGALLWGERLVEWYLGYLV